MVVNEEESTTDTWVLKKQEILQIKEYLNNNTNYIANPRIVLAKDSKYKILKMLEPNALSQPIKNSIVLENGSCLVIDRIENKMVLQKIEAWQLLHTKGLKIWLFDYKEADCDIFNEYFFLTHLNGKYGNYKDTTKKPSINFLDLSSEVEESSEIDDFSDIKESHAHLISGRAKNLNELIELKDYLKMKRVIQKKYNIKIYIQDLRTLMDFNWLNDKVINIYLGLLKDKYYTENNFYILTTYFYYNLTHKRNTTFKENILSYKSILIPVHLRNHWIFVNLDLKRRKVMIFDSLRCDRVNVGNKIKKWIEWCYLKRNETVVFEVETMKDIPRQENGNDCGIFVLYYAKQICKRKTEFPRLYLRTVDKRLTIMHEIMVGKILYS